MCLDLDKYHNIPVVDTPFLPVRAELFQNIFPLKGGLKFGAVE